MLQGKQSSVHRSYDVDWLSQGITHTHLHPHTHTDTHTPVTFLPALFGQAQSLTFLCHSIQQAIFAFVIINIKYVQRQIFGFGDLEVVNELMYSHEESRGVRVFLHTHGLSAFPAPYGKGLSVVMQGKTHNF